MAERSETLVCSRSLAGIADWNPAGAWMSVVCCQVEVSAAGRSLVQRIPTESSVSVIAKSQQSGGIDPLKLSSHKRERGNNFIFMACVCVCVCVRAYVCM